MNEQLREIFIILQEECAEVIVEISKCLRFGPHQILEGTEDSNIKELGDLQAMIELLVDENVGVSVKNINKAKKKKFEKLKQWSNLKVNK